MTTAAKAFAIVGWCIAMIVGGLLSLSIAERNMERDMAEQREAEWQAKYDSAGARVDTQVKKVAVLVTRWDTIYQDTGRRITDTAWVIRTLAAADTTIRACTELVSSCELFRRTADSTLAAKDARIASLKPRWRDRCGVSLGVAALRDGNVVRAGPALSAGCRIWP